MASKIGKVLIVGAGISGIRSALNLAEVGYQVVLTDRAPHIGGVLCQLDHQFPSNHCGMCRMLPMIDRDAASQYCLRRGFYHQNIELFLSTDITGVEGESGSYRVTLHQKPGIVDPDRCVVCGKCEDVCPVEIPDAFNADLSTRKAIYRPLPHAMPGPYIIDLAHCTHCGECESACPTGAIRFSDADRKDFRILVVDDEFIVRDSLKALLEDEGFFVEVAGSGDEAIEKSSRDRFHLMLLDIKMPDKDGVEVLKEVKETCPDICVVMMTAYATIETAVESMKIGATDYLVKPFEPDTLIPKTLRIYEDLKSTADRTIEAGAIILCGGTGYFNPKEGKNTFGYGVNLNVITNLEFERLISGTGPCRGRFERPSDGKAIGRIAWIQCVGSRDLQTGSDFCSSICCMSAIKEAMLAKTIGGESVEAVIFYMDMRTFDKSFQRYRDEAEQGHGVRFHRGRVHSVVLANPSGDLLIRHMDLSGERHTEIFDLVVLSVGQRPSPGSSELAEMIGMELNPWGFFQPSPMSLTKTSRDGIFLGGSFSGLKDISDTVIQAGAAACGASRAIHTKGGSLSDVSTPVPVNLESDKELPEILVLICGCGEKLSQIMDMDTLSRHFSSDLAVCQVALVDQICTDEGRQALLEQLEAYQFNRLLIGACMPMANGKKQQEIADATGLISCFVDIVDIYIPEFYRQENPATDEIKRILDLMEYRLKTGIVSLKNADPGTAMSIPIVQSALVVGGGIAGMTAALSIADHGYKVDLVEKAESLGGNLRWIHNTINGDDVSHLLEHTIEQVKKHALIQVHTNTEVADASGTMGRFQSKIRPEEGEACVIDHGITILATGGKEAVTNAYGYGSSDAIITQKELEQAICDKTIDPSALSSMAMILCVDSREEPRNYCSRICCITALKQALALKSINPELSVFVLYRDIMAYGFFETYFTKARESGIIFIAYDKTNKPEVALTDEKNEPSASVFVSCVDPILGQPVEIETDLLVLATGVVPTLNKALTDIYGAEIDEDGFFLEAESKWQPLDSLKAGVFACGLAHSPRLIPEAIASAEAAAMQGLGILCRKSVRAGKTIAVVRHSLCSTCKLCIDTCIYGARSFDEDADKIEVNPVLCQGCGACAAVCPNSASVLLGHIDQQMFEVIDASIN